MNTIIYDIDTNEIELQLREYFEFPETEAKTLSQDENFVGVLKEYLYENLDTDVIRDNIGYALDFIKAEHNQKNPQSVI